MSKLPPARASHQLKWKAGGWLLHAYILDNEPVSTRAYFRNPYLNSLGDQLRQNITFKWIRGDLGPIDEPNIDRAFIAEMWTSLIDHGYLGRNGAIMDFYVNRECLYWDKLLRSTKSIEV